MPLCKTRCLMRGLGLGMQWAAETINIAMDPHLRLPEKKRAGVVAISAVYKPIVEDQTCIIFIRSGLGQV